MNSSCAQRIAIAVAGFFLLTAFSSPINLKSAPGGVVSTYVFVDARPVAQLKSGNESLLITNCAYGSYRLGDKEFNPGLATVLNGVLVQRFNDALRGKTVKLVNFTVHVNNSRAIRQMITSQYHGLIDSLANDHKVSGCSADDLRGGYVLGEVEQGKAPYIVVIDLEIDSKLIHMRWIEPNEVDPYIKGADRKETKALRLQARDAAINGVIDHALAKLGDDITQSLSGSLPAASQEAVSTPAPSP